MPQPFASARASRVTETRIPSPNPWAGAAHSRNAPLVLTVVATGHLLTVLAWNAVFAIDLAWDQPPRGVGAPEIVGTVMSAVLPALLVPSLNQDHRGGRRGRTIAVICCAAALLVTVGILGTWHATLAFTTSPGSHPPVHNLVGNLVLIASTGWVSVLVLGRAIGQLVSLGLTCGFLLSQQRWPNTPISTWFSTGDRWHTSWPITLVLTSTVLFLAWRTGGIPLVDKGVD